MSDLDQAIAIAQAEVALWAEVEREWRIPKNDLTAHFVRKDAKARRETAEKIASEIGALATRSSTSDIGPLSQGCVMAPGVLWSAWSETDADSDPSDPGVTYCTEWFVGRWPIGAKEPDCRILIGTGRTAEIIARRVAEKLTSILNTDRLCVARAEPDTA